MLLKPKGRANISTYAFVLLAQILEYVLRKAAWTFFPMFPETSGQVSDAFSSGPMRSRLSVLWSHAGNSGEVQSGIAPPYGACIARPQRARHDAEVNFSQANYT